MTVRTRIAPSPTGDPHVGTAYIALFNWAFARTQGGEFLLRLEDTDQARSSATSEQMILEALNWLGIEWAEGPDIGGPSGPYRQSERLPIYAEHVQRLLDGGQAFHCFCSAERLDTMRKEQRERGETTRYDGACLNLSAEEVARRVQAGESHVVRMRVPESGECVFEDALRGEIRIPFGQIDMQVLVKADGFPTYHLAVVVDDHLMGITHVLRGEEWINSMPKHLLLYDYFGWTPPVHAHLPLLRNPDQSKLSKRKNPTSVAYYKDIGVLPEAMANYLGLMGFSMPDEREMFSLQEFAEQFHFDRISLGGPIFDLEKLRWLNGQYLRNLSTEAFAQRVGDWIVNSQRLSELVPLVHERTELLQDLAPLVDYLIGARRAVTVDDLSDNKLSAEQTQQILDHTLRSFEQIGAWERDALFAACQQLAEHMQLKLRDFLKPLFMAISGKEVSLPLFDSLIFLGPNVSRARLRDALDVIGVSKKAAKRLEKNYAAFLQQSVS